MTYLETIEYLYNQLPVYQNIGGVAYKEGLDNSLALDTYFSHPHRKYKTIHIAGTNGKGSTSHLLAAILQQSGYKVGLYTSPHLVDFRERIRVNGEKINQQYVVDFVAKHKHYYESIHPSFFELTMMMSFLYFADKEIDVAVIETGLGGRLDSTNIITPDLAVITNISLDHVQFLGDTIEKIAIEKAGIIKPHIPVVIGEADIPSVHQIFESVAHEKNAPIVFAEDQILIASCRLEKNAWIFESKNYPTLKGELGGYAQVKNAGTVLTAIEELKKIDYNISNAAVYSGFANVVELTGLMGRWQRVGTLPTIICDTGHNSTGMQYNAEQLATEIYDCLHIVIGMVNDKDVTQVLSLLPKDAIYYFTRASIPRSLSETELQEKAHAVGLQGSAYASVKEALSVARSNATEQDMIFVGGSNFIVADALSVLGYTGI